MLWEFPKILKTANETSVSVRRICLSPDWVASQGNMNDYMATGAHYIFDKLISNLREHRL